MHSFYIFLAKGAKYSRLFLVALVALLVRMMAGETRNEIEDVMSEVLRRNILRLMNLRDLSEGHTTRPA